MQVNLDALQTRLNEPIVQTKKHHGLLLIVTPSTRWLVKPIRNSERARWWAQADKVIRQRDFRSMPTFFIWQNSWLVMRYICGRTAQYSNIRDLQLCAKLLANFHLASRNVPPTAFIDSKSTLHDRLEKRFERYARLYRQLKYFPLLNIAGEQYLRLGEQALSRVNETALQAITLTDIEEGAVAHRDLASHNILINRDKQAWLIDFETAGFDAQLGDLWQMTSRVLVEWHWRPRIYNCILYAYESIRPLNTAERKALSQLFLFPNDFYREALGLIKQRRGFSEQKVLPYLQMIVNDQKRWYAFLKWLGVAW